MNEYPIPTDWMLGSLADVAALPSQFATDHQRTLLDSAHLFAHHADHLPAIARAVDALHAHHVPALTAATASALAACRTLTPQSSSAQDTAQALDKVNAQLALIKSLKDAQSDLQVILNVPTLLSRAVDAIRPASSIPGSDTDTDTKHEVDPLGSLVDAVFALVAAVAALERRMARRTSLSHASSSSAATSPTASTTHLPTDPHTTISLVVARARAIVATDLHAALLAHLTLATSPLPTLLRAVAHLRRLDPSPHASHRWAHAFLTSRMSRLPRPPSATPGDDATLPPLATDTALAWLDAVRGHMFDTWAHARVVFPDCHVHPLALHAARELRGDLARVVRQLGNSPQDLALVARHAHSAWGTACRRLGWDLGVPVVRPVVDAELVRRLQLALTRAVQDVVGAPPSRGMAEGGEAAAADPDRPETWAQVSRPLTAFVAQVVEAVNAATFPRIPVARMLDMAKMLAEALVAVDRHVKEQSGSAEVHAWSVCLVPHLVKSWDKVVEAAGLRGDDCAARVRLRVGAQGVVVMGM